MLLRLCLHLHYNVEGKRFLRNPLHVPLKLWFVLIPKYGMLIWKKKLTLPLHRIPLAKLL